MPPTRHHDAPILMAAATLLLVGLSGLLYGALPLATEIALRVNGVPVEAVVEATRRGDVAKPAQFVRASYRDANGAAATAEFMVPSNLQTAPGRPIALRHDPAAPDVAVYDDLGWFLEQAILRAVMTLIALGSLAVGAWIGWRGWRAAGPTSDRTDP